MKHTTLALSTIVLFGAGLTGCGGGATIGSNGGGGSAPGGTLPIVTTSATRLRARPRLP